MSSLSGNKLPNGWQGQKLVEICELITDGSHYSPATIDKGYPYVTVRDVSWSGQIDLLNSAKISEQEFKKLKAGNCSPKQGDILYSKDGTVGKLAIVNQDEEFVVLSSLAILRPSSVLYSEFLFYSMMSPEFQEFALSRKTGAAIKRVVLRTIKEFQIPVPPLEEQKRIVAKIDTLFSKIDKAISLTDESLKQAKNLLPSVLNEVFEKGKADGWEEKKLEEVCEKITDGSHNPPKSCEGSELMMLSGRNVRDNKLDFEKVRFVSEKDFINEDKRTNIQAGDVLLTIVGSIGRSFVFPKGSPKVIFQRSVAVIKPNSILNPYFLSYFFKSPESQEKLNTQARGAAQKGVYLKDIRKLQLLLPNIETQNEKVLFLDIIDLKTKQTQSKLEEQLAYLKQLKSSILSKAFKGEL